MELSELKRERLKNNISLIEMAERLGITYNNYYRYESGRRSVPAEVAADICKILNKRPSEIFLPNTMTVRQNKDENKNIDTN